MSNVDGRQVLDLVALSRLSLVQRRLVWRLTRIKAVMLMLKQIVISDYPAPAALANIRANAQGAIPDDLRSLYSIEGHEWGNLDSSFAVNHANYFDRILAADCFWMPSQHLNLARSMLHFLTMDPGGRVFAVAGFHTGRAKLAAFFHVAQGEGLEIDEIFEEDADGVRRQWTSSRDDGKEDDLIARKRWLVIARLKRRIV